jgi:imidazolonepropionase-like amidohydrolase
LAQTAETLGKGSQDGSVDVGKIADLLVVAENPLDELEALRQPRAVNGYLKPTSLR